MLVEDGVMTSPISVQPPPPLPVSRGPPYTYTSHMDLVDELQVQGDMIQRVSAQQHFILSELARMRSGALPPPAGMQPVRQAATCM